jgi:hypothetical protein
MNFAVNNNSSMSLDYFVENHRKGPRLHASDESIVTNDSLGPQLDKGVSNPVKPSSKRGGRKTTSHSTKPSLGAALGKMNDSFMNDSAVSFGFETDELTCMTTDSREIAVMSGAPPKSKTRGRRRPQKV